MVVTVVFMDHVCWTNMNCHRGKQQTEFKFDDVDDEKEENTGCWFYLSSKQQSDSLRSESWTGGATNK